MLDFSKNYFELFGLPVSFTVDAAELATRYRALQRALHPDRYTNATEQEKRLSVQGAGLVNDAFETLKAPLARARYLLELKGIESAEGGSGTDAAFLMEQMELREELAEVKDKADPHGAIADLLARIEGRIRALLDDLAKQLQADTPDALKQAQESVSKLQFLHRLRSQAEELEAELDETL